MRVSQIIEQLEKARGFPVGTIRTWNGIDHIKHADGWVCMSGPNAGKVVGKYKESATHMDFVNQHKDKTFDHLDELVDRIVNPKIKSIYYDENGLRLAIRKESPKDPSKKGIVIMNVSNDPSKKGQFRALLEKIEAKTNENIYFDLVHPGRIKDILELNGYKPIESINGYGKEKQEDVSAPDEHKDKAEDSFDLEFKKMMGQQSEDEIKTPSPIETEAPRAAAQKQNKEYYDRDGSYEFARASDVSNLGEDILGSARHTRNAFRSLEDIEKAGEGAKLITKKELLKADPLKLTENVEDSIQSHLDAAYLQFAMNKFPAAPKVKTGLRRWLRENEGKTEKDYGVFLRKEYYETFNNYKKVVEGLLNDKRFKDISEKNSFLRQHVKSEIKRLRDSNNYYDDMANLLVSTYNTGLSTYTKSSALSQTKDFIKTGAKAYGLDSEIKSTSWGISFKDLDSAVSKLEENNPDELKNACMNILEGKSTNAAFGVKGEARNKGFNIDVAKLYNAKAERKGPKGEFKNQEEQSKFISEKLKMRGLQWGNSVTDEERKHHMEQIALAFKDLSDVLEIPYEQVTLNGKLALAVGARGKGTALAHYEPDNKVINLTRKGGVGSLAHEWGHFLDNLTTGGWGNFLSDNSKWNPDTPSERAMHTVLSSFAPVAERIRKTETYRKLSDKQKSYWTSTEEMFARCFEKYVDYKLESMDRKNTYLAGAEDHEFWPNKEELKDIAPAMDNLFEILRDSGKLKKSIDDLINSLYK